ncbi:hypothetical protein EDC04DRAFT_2501128, partial [Pisolithus marmoratus]
MSTALVFGFFGSANSKHVKTLKTGSSSITYHCLYETTIQCTSGVIFPAMLCIYSPFNDVALPDNTIAFISAKASIPSSVPDEPVLLEGMYVIPIPGDPTSDVYEHAVPNFPYPVVVGLGVISTQPQTLSDGTSKEFTIISTDYVQDMRMMLIVCCFFDSAHPCWSKTPIPNHNSVIHYIGCFCDLALAGGLHVELESIALNMGAMDSKALPSTQAGPAMRRHKFAAVV